MIGTELQQHMDNLVQRINDFGGEAVPGGYDLVESVTEQESRYIEMYYLPPVVLCPEDGRAVLLASLEASWTMVESEERSEGPFSQKQLELRMRWGKAVNGICAYLLRPTTMTEILAPTIRPFASDVVVRISRWSRTTTGWYSRCRPYATRLVEAWWQGRIDQFREGTDRRVWAPPGIKGV